MARVHESGSEMSTAPRIIQQRIPKGRILDQMTVDSMGKRAPQAADRAGSALRARDDQHHQDEQPTCTAGPPRVRLRRRRGGSVEEARRGTAGSGHG